MIIKVTDQSQTQSKPMSVAENETFDSFKEKVEAKLGFRIERFLCSELEIGDDTTLTEMLKSPPRPPSTVHCLVAVKSGELLLDENNNPVDLESIRKQINEIETGEKEKNASTLQYYELKIRALQNDYNNLLGKSIRAERSRIAELKVEIDTAQICKPSFCELKTAEVVDVCFLMECTTSMKLFVMEAKTLVHRLVEKLGKRFVDLKLRCAFVGYRDYCGIEDRVNAIAFTDDKEAFKEAVDSIKPIGGGDITLDVFGGLEEVLKLEWKSPTRLLLHIGNAPCHGSRFNDPPINDHFPKGNPRGLDIDNLLSNLTSKNIDYYFAEIHPCTQKMINVFNEILLKNKGKPIEVLRVSSSNELLSIVSWSISNSILNSQSLSMVEVKSKPMKTYQVESPINWSDSSGYELFEADLYETSFSGDITEIRTNRVEYKTRKVDLCMAKKPFTKGGLRFAFAALINMGKRENPDIVKCVLKESVFTDVKYNTEDYMKSLIEIQVISKFLAEKFKSVCKLKLKFLSVNLLRINSTGVFYSCEEFVDGSFTKWTNNSGIVNEEDYSMALNAFSHWSYQATDKYLIVTDLQGFKTGGDEYVLTDPAITCVQEPLRFSSTNLAVKGVEKFFRSHQCNRICRELRLEKNALQIMSDI